MPSETQPDPESSLFPRQQHFVLPASIPDASLSTLGAASLGPAHLTAYAHAMPGPLLDEIGSPKESLNALVTRMSVVNMPQPPDYDTVYRMLREREKDLEVAAKIGQALLRRNELLEADLSAAADTKLQSEQQLAQLRFNVSQKDELLRLYARDAKEREGKMGSEEEGNPEWVNVLAEECKELRESNLQLRQEADHLRHETAEVERKERELVHQCLVQFTEAKQRLSDLREEVEQTAEENSSLQSKLKDLNVRFEEQLTKHQQLLDETDLLREQLADAHDTHSQLTNEVSEWQEKYGECSVMLKEAQEEIVTLKEMSQQRLAVGNGSSDQLPTIVEHESIVQEIEEVLRKEIIAASTLPERPRSPNHYARQRTMVVMETVKAATLAMSRKQERLAAEAEQMKSRNTQGVTPPVAGSTPTTKKPVLAVNTGVGIAAFSPISTSSPHNVQSQPAARGVSAGTTPLSPSARELRKPPSPIFSDAGSTISMPDEFMRFRNQPYVAPEKLQIVKPLEGSVTLLKWKLLATPQLGGATTFFSDASRPGVHVKGWKAAGIVDKKEELATECKNRYLGVNMTRADLRQKSMSTTDLSFLNATYPQPSLRRKLSKKERVIRTKASQLNVTVGDTGHGMNDITELLPSSGGPSLNGSSLQTLEERDRPAKQQSSPARQQDRMAKRQDRRAVQENKTVQQPQGKSSLFRQVGNFLGSGLSRFGFVGKREEEEEEEREERQSPEAEWKGSSNVGLTGVL